MSRYYRGCVDAPRVEQVLPGLSRYYRDCADAPRVG